MAENINKYIEKTLFSMQDTDYRSFHLKLMPGVDPDTVIGVRTPLLGSFLLRYSSVKTGKTLFPTCRTNIMTRIISTVS